MPADAVLANASSTQPSSQQHGAQHDLAAAPITPDIGMSLCRRQPKTLLTHRFLRHQERLTDQGVSGNKRRSPQMPLTKAESQDSTHF
jgi:hypothetical protein